MFNKIFGSRPPQEEKPGPSEVESTGAPDDRLKGIEKLNDALYELRGCESPAVEVIFFHGLQIFNYEDAYWKTWLSRNESLVWPRVWLGKQLPNARILSVSYDSVAFKSREAGKLDPHRIAENLVTTIVLDQRYAAGQSCPVVLAGHSLGGIMIKKFLMALHDQKNLLPPQDSGRIKMENFLRNCKGVFYYSSPQAGSNLATYLKYLPYANTPIAELLEVLGNETARLNDEFCKTRRLYGIATHAIFESLETRKYGLRAMVVKEASNRVDLDRIPYSTHADHFDVCKPTNNKNDNIVFMLVDFIEDLVRQSNEQEQTSAYVPLQRHNSDRLL